MIHKRILSAAEERPDASIAELSAEIGGATVELVERVLNEYGDPADQTAQSENDQTAQTKDDESIESDAPANRSEGDRMIGNNGHHEKTADELQALSEKQRETLQAISEYPEATQAELADLLGVTPATINTRLNTIENFDWDQRDEYVKRLGFDPTIKDYDLKGDSEEDDRTEGTTGAGLSQQPDASIHGADGPAKGETKSLARQVHALRGQINSVEERLEGPSLEASPLSDDPELAHKVLHACMSSDQITEDEELRIVKLLLNQSPQ